MGQKNIAEVSTRVGIPILIKGFLDRTPSEASEMAIEEDMVCILVRTTHHTIAIGRPVPFCYVIRGQESVVEHLPKEDVNFEGVWSLSITPSYVQCRALHQFIV